MRFKDKVVLITGATGGIGKALLNSFLSEGAKVAIVGRDSDKTNELAKYPGVFYHSTLDITQSINCKKIVDDVFGLSNSLDVVVNNAGAMFRGDTTDTPDSEWLRLFDINVHAVFYLSRESIRVMRENKIQGSIVQIASNSALRGRKAHVAYATTKGAVVQMTKCMALDCAADGIRVNAVCPGATDTSMPMSKHTTQITRAQLIENCKRDIPLQRMAEPSEIAQSVLFISSGDAAYITGTTLSVDGGTSS